MQFLHRYLFLLLGFCFAVPALSGPKVQGKVTGFGVLKNDDVIDGAIVVPTLRPQDLLTFQLDQFLAPNEVMKVGPVSSKVPGNMYFPKQKESYGILPLSIEKDPFSFYPKVAQSEELTALWFAAPFNKVADMARAKAPYYEIMSYVKLKGFGITADQDWSNVPTTMINLDKTYSKKLSYKWSRTAVVAKDFDLVLSFQKTNAARWTVSDFIVKAPPQALMNVGQGLSSSSKNIFMRIHNNQDLKPVSAEGFIRNAESGDTIELAGLPDSLGHAKLVANRVTWNSISRPGMMAVLIGNEKTQNANEEEVFDVFGHFGFRGLWNILVTRVDWVEGTKGFYDIVDLKTEDSVTVVFVGMDKQDPDIFTHATDLAMLRLK